MQIEWLDPPHFDKCRVIRKGRAALLERRTVYDEGYYAYWVYSVTGRRAGWWLSFRIERASRRAYRSDCSAVEWQPLTNLPEAKVVTSSDAGR